MTDDEREVLAKDCESAGVDAFYQCKGSFSQSLGAAIRAALAAVRASAVEVGE